MSRRKRWTPIKGTGNRIYDRKERLLLAALDLFGRLVFRRRGDAGDAPIRDLDKVHEVLVLRLDRIGDVLMSLPALFALRARLQNAHIRLAVGRWSEDVARLAPVDEVLVWSAPWVGRPQEGADPMIGLARKARALRPARLGLALDLQGDIRAAALMRLTGAARRFGYANTGGAYLLTDVIPLDESVSWVEQNRRAVAAAVGPTGEIARPLLLTDGDRAFAERLFGGLKIEGRRPLVGIHPSGGRTVKQWDPRRWRDVAFRLQRDFGATILVTGSEADRSLAAIVSRDLPSPAIDLTGRLTVRETMAVIGGLDLFLSPDTGPMHLACAMRTPSISIFGPSDPIRYFSGTESDRHVVVRQDLWCSPCNLIRKPPQECAGPEPPECLSLVSVDTVQDAAAQLLSKGGYKASGNTGNAS